MSAVTINAAEVVKQRYAIDSVVASYSTTKLFPTEVIVLTKYFKEGCSILDLGCGAGRTSLDLAERGYNVEGIDFAPKMIEAAKQLAASKNLDVRFAVKDATQLDYPDASFDNVLFSYNGIEQIPGKENRLKVMQDAFRILKPGGYYIFTTRSGLAFASRRALVWIRIAYEYALNRILKNDKNWEFGDTVRGGNYFNYSNPFAIRKAAKAIGFRICYFNSQSNIRDGKSPSVFANFSSDKMLFYVFQKPE